jgi:putative oxidoreductase
MHHMTGPFAAYARATERLSAMEGLLPTLARLVFGGVLAGYFWASALTKFESFPFGLSTGAYAQIYPKQFEALGYDSSLISVIPYFVVLAGSWAEIILPALIVVGLLTRPAALGMIGFIMVQSLTDIYGHMVGPTGLGAWFDRIADAPILDQRALWVMVLLILVIKGAGPLSLDRLTRQWVSG